MFPLEQHYANFYPCTDSEEPSSPFKDLDAYKFEWPNLINIILAFPAVLCSLIFVCASYFEIFFHSSMTVMTSSESRMSFIF